MRVSTLSILATIATGVLAQQCSTSQNSAYTPRSKKFVCGRQGQVTSPVKARHFAAVNDDPLDCAEECLSDPSCLSFSFNTADATCQTYSAPVRAQGFSQKANTGDYFYYKSCFVKSGDCGVANGSFDEGSDDETPGQSQPPDYLPWVFGTSDQSRVSTAELVSPNTTNATSPNGGNYLEISNHGNNTSGIAQRVTLVNGTAYTLEFFVSKQFVNVNATGSVILVAYGDEIIYRHDVRTLPNDGSWVRMNATLQSLSANQTMNDGTVPLRLAIQAPRNATNSAMAQVAVDGISLARA